jgi:hypothetical protein
MVFPLIVTHAKNGGISFIENTCLDLQRCSFTEELSLPFHSDEIILIKTGKAEWGRDSCLFPHLKILKN